MLDIAAKCAGYELSWFVRRYNALLVGFPENLTPDILAADSLCSGYDPDEAAEALKSAHVFLSGIAQELLQMPSEDSLRPGFIEAVFSKIDLIWALGLYGKLCPENGGYCFSFEKAGLKTGKKTLPASLGASFRNIAESGCSAAYFKSGKSVPDYKSCGRGFLFFEDRFTALGIFLFIKKLTQKRWYWDEDIAGGYAKGDFIPAVHCVEPYYRIDMRVFTCGERLKYDIIEQMAGYGEELIGCFRLIIDFIRQNYPRFVPGQGFWKYISCSVGFKTDSKHRMLGQLGIGGDEHGFGFYTALSGTEMTAFMERLDEFGPDVIGNHLLDYGIGYPDLKNAAEITYRSQKVVFRDVSGMEIRFFITCRADAFQAIKIMELKAAVNKNTL